MPLRSRRPWLALVALIAASCSAGSQVSVQAETSTTTAPDEGVVVSSSSLGTIDFAEPDDDTDEAEEAPPERTVVGEAVTPSVTVHQTPEGEEVRSLANPTVNGGPLVFQVLTDPPDGEWLEVALPIRPNGSTGWVHRDQISLSSNPYRIEIDTSTYSIVVTKAGTPVLESTVAVGTGDTPTPYGEFYVIELLEPSSPDGPYGPFAFGLSGFSEVLESFAGGEGVIGIHGTDAPHELGSEVSHGCIRVSNEVVSAMAEWLPLGTPVQIY